jgi:hypothetical protein
MICFNCKIDRLFTDFINNQKFCYRCTYRIKLQKMMEKRTKKPVLCRTCGKKIIRKENDKKRQRTVFCSFECAEKGHKELVKNYWTRNICSLHPCPAKRENKCNSNQK